jgi:hypothetical protein
VNPSTQKPKPMSRADWRKTPYAASEARDPDKNIRDILVRYKVADIQSTETTGPNGRPSYFVRFKLAGKIYRVGMEVLNAQASPDELMKQTKRAIFHLLKSLLEYSSVFAPVEQVLFAFIETPLGLTMYECAKPQLDKLEAPDFTRMLALPAAKGDA